MNKHAVVSPEQWLVARRALLAKEKELRRLRDNLHAEQRALPALGANPQELHFRHAEEQEISYGSLPGAPPSGALDSIGKVSDKP